MSRYGLSLFVFFLPFIVWAQPAVHRVQLSGKVQEAGENIPVEGASVRLLSAADSTLVKGTTTDRTGDFVLTNVPVGKYIVSCSFVGFVTGFRPVTVTARSNRMELGTFLLSDNPVLLQEAVITAKAPEVVVKEDTIEYNADSYKTQVNAVVEDLLKKLPGVEVDKEGKITANGKEVSKILVDGKEFFSDDPKVASKNLPVDIVDKLQVVDRKSDLARLTGVDDGENETVINLTIKKGMKKGWFGHVQGGGGNTGRYAAQVMVNRFVGDNQFTLLGGANNVNERGFSDLGGGLYNRGGGGNGITSSHSGGMNFNIGNGEKFRIGGDLMYSGSDLVSTRKTSRQNLLKDSVSYSNSSESSRTKSRNVTMNFRMRWEIDTLSALEFMPSFGYNHTRLSERENSETLDGDRHLVNTARDSTESRAHGFNLSGRLSFTHGFASKKGRRVSASFTYRLSRAKTTEFTDNERVFYANDSLDRVDQEIDNKNWSGNYRVNLSYVEPVFKSSFLTFAYNYRFNNSNADKLAYDRLSDMSLDSAYSNRFRNDFQTQQINVAFKTVRPKYTYNVGINVDPSSSKSENLIDTARNVPRRTVVNVSPSVYFVYMFSKRRNLRIDYRGRTTQPSISQLQPVRNITNPLVIRLGNENLNPSYTNSFSVRYNDYVPETQRSMMAYFSGSFVLNSIVDRTDYKATGEQIIQPVNVNGVWDASGAFMYSTPFAEKKFQLNTHTYLGYRNTIGFTAGRDTGTEKNRSGTLTARENVSLYYRSDWFDAGLRGNYRYSRTMNSLLSDRNQDVMNYGGTFDATVHLPWNIEIGSSLDYSGSSGYASGFDRNQWIWNAQLSTQFLKEKQAMLMFKIYDILKQQSNISRQVTGNYIQDVEYNTLTSYFMFTFSYRFNTMGGKRRGPDGPPSEEGRRRPDRGSRPPGGFHGDRRL